LPSCTSQQPINVNTSLILNNDQRALVQQWVRGTNWTLCWRGSYHGSSARAFHAGCDNKGRTVTIVKSSKGQIFGGYTKIPWRSAGGFVYDPSAFIFLLKDFSGVAPLRSDRPYNSKYSIYDHGASGPGFGDNFVIGDKSMLSFASRTHPNSFTYGANDIGGNAPPVTNMIFTESHTFSLLEMEVYVTASDLKLTMEESVVLNSTHIQYIRNWTGESNWYLCYRASRDTFSPVVFHTHCDSKGKTLSIMQSTGGYLLGNIAFFIYCY
jgi:hypothetical protein